MSLGHSNGAISARLLLEILKLDEELGGQAFARTAARFDGPNADARSHVMMSAEFANLAHVTLPTFQAQRALRTLLRALVRLQGLSPQEILNVLPNLAERPEVLDYYEAWGRGHLFGDAAQ